jgi:hypothetical protein
MWASRYRLLLRKIPDARSESTGIYLGVSSVIHKSAQARLWISSRRSKPLRQLSEMRVDILCVRKLYRFLAFAAARTRFISAEISSAVHPAKRFLPPLAARS